MPSEERGGETNKDNSTGGQPSSSQPLSTSPQLSADPSFSDVSRHISPESPLGEEALRTGKLDGKDEESVAIKGANGARHNEERPTELLYGWRLYVVQFCLFFSLILSVMDSSVVATALVTIGNDFNDFLRLQWVVLSYLLTYLGFALIFSRISDVVGRKWTTLTALVILVAFSAGCGWAQSLEQLIAFRAFQGLGGSGLYAMPLTVLPEITPPEKFPLMSALSGICFAVAAVLGPTLGGIITTQSTWRWVFWFNIPCGALILVLTLIAWPDMHTAGRLSWRQLDFFGCLLYVAASCLLVFALQQAGAGTYAWSSSTIIACLVVSGIAALVFGIWIWYLSAKERAIAPLFPARIITNRIMLSSILVSTLVGYLFYTVLVELPERFQVVNGKSSQTAGLMLLAVSGASAVGSGSGGRLSSKANRSFYTLTAGSGFALLGAGLLYSLGFSHNVPHKLYGYEVLIGFGFGLTFVSTTIVIKLHADDRDAASAQGLMAQSRILGGNIGLAIATIILNQHLTSDLNSLLSPSQISDLRHSLNAIRDFTPNQVVAVAESFSRAFKGQMEVCIGIAALSFVICWAGWMRDPPSFEGKAKEREEKEKEKEQAEKELAREANSPIDGEV